MDQREYTVTLHRHEDLDSFYRDMENQGGTLFIPYRQIPVTDRQPVSRNTSYKLTEAEANRILRDPRVASVVLSPRERNVKLVPLWTQTSTFWNKSNSVANSHRNWAILRCYEGAQRSGWGSNGTQNQSGTVNVTASGKHVDVVIVDGNINPAHPEYAVNTDGSGGSRVNQINWFTYASTVGDGANVGGTYTYTPYIDASYPDNDGDGYSDRTVNNDHGAHVAGTVAGNTQGWARDCNIYNINPYASASSFTYYFLQYIKVWHQNKPVNPITGVKNPTITNHSYGIEYVISISAITSVRYKGTIFTGPFSGATLSSYGIYNNGTNVLITGRDPTYEADFQDLINAGVIVIGAAGNSYSKIANYSADPTDDYNNYLVAGSTYYYMRGSITAADNVVCVGSVDTVVAETKMLSSMCGPRIDLYAPGRLVMSSHNSNIFGTAATDARNASYYVTKKSGTSMASPQVAGIISCLAETWPRLRQSDVITYLQRTSKQGQVGNTGGGITDYTDLQGSTNRYMFFYKERPVSGQVGPKVNYGNRPSNGQVYPRSKIFRYGKQ